mmetsp:Transcript_6592/g.14296  ORF Transcript_6592/g.14296 Transcript_6592/m.14296 type:complete len:86 (+) Transcript_6592:123-380(+)
MKTPKATTYKNGVIPRPQNYYQYRPDPSILGFQFPPAMPSDYLSQDKSSEDEVAPRPNFFSLFRRSFFGIPWSKRKCSARSQTNY